MNQSAAPPRTRLRVQPWLLVLALCAVYLTIILFANQGDPLVFVTLGTQFTEGNSNGTEGYDGQFTYFIAVDPGTAADYIDVPAYRFQRILLPILARLLGLGQPALIPWVLLLINITSLVAGTYFLEQLLIMEKASRWYALTYGLFVGMFMAVRLSLNEPLAYGLVIGGIWLERKRGALPAAILFALAALAKETTLVFTAGYLLWLLLEKRWRTTLLFGVVAGLPFALWQIVLYTQFGAFGVGSGGAMATPFEIIPYNGFWRLLTDPETGSLKLFAVFALFLLPFIILPSLWALYRSGRDLWQNNWHPYVFLLFANAAIMPFVPFSTYREPLGILRFIVGLVLMTVLYGALRHERRVLRYGTFWVVLTLMVFSMG